jgi:hypothetical protein
MHNLRLSTDLEAVEGVQLEVLQRNLDHKRAATSVFMPPQTPHVLSTSTKLLGPLSHLEYMESSLVGSRLTRVYVGSP